MIEYKRKFLVPGETVKTCHDFRKQCMKLREDSKHPRALPCNPTQSWSWSRSEEKCPFPINKPNDYIVSETTEGEWQCSCKAWTTHKPRIDCKHIIKAKADPKKYEVAVDWTGKTLETIKKVTG